MIVVRKTGQWEDVTEAQATMAQGDPNFLVSIPATTLDAVTASLMGQGGAPTGEGRICFWCGAPWAPTHVTLMCPRVKILHVNPDTGKIVGYEFFPRVDAPAVKKE